MCEWGSAINCSKNCKKKLQNLIGKSGIGKCKLSTLRQCLFLLTTVLRTSNPFLCTVTWTTYIAMQKKISQPQPIYTLIYLIRANILDIRSINYTKSGYFWSRRINKITLWDERGKRKTSSKGQLFSLKKA